MAMLLYSPTSSQTPDCTQVMLTSSHIPPASRDVVQSILGTRKDVHFPGGYSETRDGKRLNAIHGTAMGQRLGVPPCS